MDGQTLYYPEDLEAHGSWIAFSDNGIAACLLNGGNKSYIRKGSYRKSRGLVVLESFNFSSGKEFHQHYNFTGIEPFTLLIKRPEEFFKIIHNEDETLIESLNPRQRNIWSSTTLYTDEVRAKRRKWFEDWLAQNPKLSPENIQAFHSNAGDGDLENDLVMSRWGMLKTLSITQISLEDDKASLVYRDFIHNSADSLTVVTNR